MDVRVNMKVFGKRRNVIDAVPFSFPEPPGTTEQLIRETVSICVSDFNRRVENASLLSALTTDQINDKAESGKIAFGLFGNTKKASAPEAGDNAIQAFEDGIFRVFLDDKELISLSEPIRLTEDSVLTFVRLTMLSGRMW